MSLAVRSLVVVSAVAMGSCSTPGGASITAAGATGSEGASTTVSTPPGMSESAAPETGADASTTVAGTTSGSGDGDGQTGSGTTDGSTGTPPQTPQAPLLQGYGTDSDFGSGGETCTVTNLRAGGEGSLSWCATVRDQTGAAPTPRRVVFDVGGVITLDKGIPIEQPYLTIDGFTAPDPGITVVTSADFSNGIVVGTQPATDTCAHDVLIQGIRVQGAWDPEVHGESTLDYPALIIDGEEIPDCLHHVVFNAVTVAGAFGSGAGIWGSAREVTVQYSAFFDSLHPQTISFVPADNPDQTRTKISIHHNLYANTHERSPQLVGATSEVHYEQNIVHNWAAYGFGGGYGVRVRCRDGVCPSQINMIANHFTSGSTQPATAVVFGLQLGLEKEDEFIATQVFMADNVVPSDLSDVGEASEAFPRDPVADVDVLADVALLDAVLPQIGAPFRTAAESDTFGAVETAVTAK